ncbi:MAG TPA: protein kinase [Candidatus Eisenbacteria bacterium]|nr:protein kinase [Candidatus Eisenbacteria bacterium]
MPVAAGTKLGPYEIVAPIGAGGMGEVYKARDTRLERAVAIKVLPEHLSLTPDLRTRFDREAKAVSSLNHPNICTLYDIGHQDGIDYLVMEHLEGETLAQRLERGPLPVSEALKVASEIADALDKAHRQGMVHRDLKPGNVMLTKTGAKLLDFGLARVTSGPGAAPLGTVALSRSPTMSTPLTAAGMIVGTFQYMAPEQLEGQEADTRSDIWAFGATLYEMITGRRAFEGATQASLIASILKEHPRPVAEFQPLTPPGLDRIVDRCLQKDPDNRWQSARDLAHELRWIAEAGSKAGVPAPVAARRQSRDRLLTMIAAAGLLTSIVLAALLVLRRPSEPEVLRFDIRPPSAVQFQDAPRISPDGRYLAYTATDSTGASRIWLRALSAATAQPMPGTEGIQFRPFWSYDSKFLGFFAGNKLKKIAVSGGPATSLADVATGADGAWSRDGVILYDGATNDPIRQVSAGGGTPTTAVAGDTTKNEQLGWPFFLPDGKHYLFLDVTSHTLRVGKVGSKEVRVLGPCDSRAEYAPPGYVLFVRNGTLVAQAFDVGALKLKGDPFPIAEPVRSGPNGGADFSVSQNGVLIYAAGNTQSGRLLWVDRSGKELETVRATGIDNFHNLALSPDGRRAAVRVIDPVARKRDLWTIDIARGVPSRFTFDPDNENHPLWSPDGQQILYWSDQPAASGLYLKNANGAGEARKVLAGEGELACSSWSRDGRSVLYGFNNPKSAFFEIWLLPMTGEAKPTPLITGPYHCGQAVFSPDGRWVAYTSTESGKAEIYVQSFPERSGKWQISANGGTNPRWAHNGRELFFLSPEQRIMAAEVNSTPAFEASVPRPLFIAHLLFPGTQIRSYYELSPDDQRFLLVATEPGDVLAGSSVIVNWTKTFEK